MIALTTGSIKRFAAYKLEKLYVAYKNYIYWNVIAILGYILRNMFITGDYVPLADFVLIHFMARIFDYA